MIARITGGRVKPGSPVPLSFRLAGPASSPRIEGLSVEAAAKALLGESAAGALGKILGGSPSQGGKADAGKKLEDAAKKGLEGLFGK